MGAAEVGLIPAVVGLEDLLADALEDFEDGEDDVSNDAGTGTLDILGAYAAYDSVDNATPNGTLFDLRTEANDAYVDLADAFEDLVDLMELIGAAEEDVEEAAATHLAAVVACKVENYDDYTETW